MQGSTAVRTSAHAGLARFATLWLRGLAAIAGMVFLSIVSILLGLNTPAATSPLVSWVRANPLIALLSGGALLAITGLSLLIVRTSGGSGNSHSPQPAAGARLTPLISAISVATISSVLFVGLLGTVLVRPTWCPTALCPAAQAVTTPDGIHDANLEMFFTALQSAYFAIPGDPARYSLDNLPKSIGAVYEGVAPSPSSTPPYRVAVGVHSLQRGKYGLIIEDVALLVRAVPPQPYPLNVWQAGAPLSYDTNVYQGIYSGEPAGRLIPAAYQRAPGGMVQLKPGESDAIDLQVVARAAADLQFQVRVTYRVANESEMHTLTLPRIFEVDFSSPSNWHLYEVQDGRFVAAQ